MSKKSNKYLSITFLRTNIETLFDEHQISSFIIDDVVTESKLGRFSHLSPVASTSESQTLTLRTLCDKRTKKFFTRFCHRLST